MARWYRVGEFAALTGVSIRTLHHYDRIGLLRPSTHTEAGYRLYSEQDLLGLQQVLTLRYLGFPLRQIGKLLGRPDFDLLASMRIQRNALRDRISELERIDAALGRLVEHRTASGAWAWDLVVRASAAVQESLEPKGERMDKYYTPEQMQQFEELGRKFPTEEREAMEQAWTSLIAEVRANRDLNPASPQAQAFAERWDQLTASLMRAYEGYPELSAAIGENYRQSRFEGHDRAPQQADFAFIERVKQTRGA